MDLKMWGENLWKRNQCIILFIYSDRRCQIIYSINYIEQSLNFSIQSNSDITIQTVMEKQNRKTAGISCCFNEFDFHFLKDSCARQLLDYMISTTYSTFAWWSNVYRTQRWWTLLYDETITISKQSRLWKHHV